MRRFVAGICLLAALLPACAKKNEPVATPSPAATAAAGTEPRTPQQLRAIAQLHFNSFTSGDFAAFWDDFDADAKRFITKDEYVKRLTACMRNDPNRSKPFRVVNVLDNKDGTWTVDVRYLNLQIKFPARYESGHWRFSLAADVKQALRLPMDEYLATKCVNAR